MFQICQCETSIFLAPETNTLNRNYPSVKTALEEADVFNRSKLLFQQLKNKGIKVFRRSLQLFFIFGELLRLLLDNFLSLLHIADNAFQLLLHLSDFYVHRVGDDILDFIKIPCRPAYNGINQLHAFSTDFFAERRSHLYLSIFLGFLRYFKPAPDNGSRNYRNNRKRIQNAQDSQPNISAKL